MALEEGTGVYRVPGIIMDVRNAISCYHEALEAEEMDLDDLYRVELGFDDEDIQDIANGCTKTFGVYASIPGMEAKAAHAI